MRRIPWHEVDWSAPNWVIAQMLECHESMVSKARGIHAPETQRRYKKRKIKDSEVPPFVLRCVTYDRSQPKPRLLSLDGID